MDTTAKFTSSIQCQKCSISQLCLPFALNDNELTQLDNIIQRKKPYQKKQKLVEAGQTFTSLYAVRSGSFKSYTVSNCGEEQIIAFHLPGDIIGFDAIQAHSHPSFAEALETAMICEIPYDTMDQLSATMPKLRQQILRLMSNEISLDQDMLFLLNKKTADARLASFLLQLSNRFKQRGLSSKTFSLTMTRGEIGNYLGLTVETISRLFSRFNQAGIINVERKLITIESFNDLKHIAEFSLQPDCK
ncbi:fumarate/nitrate reduction transcriptional regulator Fnr [Catenovulum agarivorans]|uniref:fumarate/nitrate reduction transcriptional regulator Fnr n=1 Tax=Catenovulum agarivorans TaxID=1172192 RepID=UPI0003089FCD|nr:fumarate/nitrate reduction transcriptional regulator Fnr [Catenovulum agarivorans]